MDAIIYILLLILVFAIILTIPIIASVFIFKITKRKYPLSISYIFASFIPLVFAYFIFTAFYPNDEFYKYEFKTITKMDFPNSGKIIKKDASYPISGDYCSSALIEFKKNDYDIILSKIQNNTSFASNNYSGSAQFNYVTKELDLQQLKYQYVDSLEYVTNANMHYIGFMNDGKTIIIHLANE